MTSRIIGIFSVSVPLLVMTLLIPGAFGGGDIKLMGGLRSYIGLAVKLSGRFPRDCDRRHIRHLSACGQEKGQKRPLCLRPLSMCGDGGFRFLGAGDSKMVFQLHYLKEVNGLALYKYTAKAENGKSVRGMGGSADENELYEKLRQGASF